MRTSVPKRVISLVFAVLVQANCGCGVFRERRPMTVQVLDGDTREPVGGATVRVSYPNMLDFTAPRPTEATTDRNGLATLRVADYRWHWVRADHSDYRVSDDFRLDATEFRELPKRGDGRVKHTFLAYSNSTPRPTVELVVPNGYRGPVKIRYETEEQPTAGRRSFKFQVSPTGHVTIRGPRLVAERPKPDFAVAYEDGTAISSHGSQDRPGQDAFRWVHCGTDSDLYVIGTEADDAGLHARVHDRLGENHWGTNRKKYETVLAE